MESSIPFDAISLHTNTICVISYGLLLCRQIKLNQKRVKKRHNKNRATNKTNAHTSQFSFDCMHIKCVTASIKIIHLIFSIVFFFVYVCVLWFYIIISVHFISNISLLFSSSVYLIQSARTISHDKLPPSRMETKQTAKTNWQTLNFESNCLTMWLCVCVRSSFVGCCLFRNEIKMSQMQGDKLHALRCDIQCTRLNIHLYICIFTRWFLNAIFHFNQ